MERLIGSRNPFYGKHHTDETKLKISNANKGRVSKLKGTRLSDERRLKCKTTIGYTWYTNGNDNIFIKGEPPVGYYRGRCNAKSAIKNCKLINNGITVRFIPKNLDIPDGWTLGGLHNKK